MTALNQPHMDPEKSITGVVADSVVIAALLAEVVDAFVNVAELRRAPAGTGGLLRRRPAGGHDPRPR